jgi:membrane-bound transcription factor site-1 protease
VISYLKQSHYYVEELNESLECVDLSIYGALVVIDSEKEFSEYEIELLKFFHEEMYLSILIMTEWNNDFIKSNIQFQNTETGNFENPTTWYIKINPSGSEYTMLNKFLANYWIEIGNSSISNEFHLNKYILKLRSSSSISRFPRDSIIFGNYLNNDAYLLSDKHERQLYKSVLGFRDQVLSYLIVVA